ncbi:MAG: hypothetical protein R3A52_08545 [Polyangiales bacterium]
MRFLKWLRSPLLLSVTVAACSATGDDSLVVQADAGRRDTGATSDARVDGGRPGTDGGVTTCSDTDGDGLSDQVEGAPGTDTDGDGTPDSMDTDSDGDGYSDADEARRAYPMYSGDRRELLCGVSGDNCDAPDDTVPNYRDSDSDNDGLTDREEFMLGTNPCAADTDGDGATDLIESAAMSDARSGDSRPPENSLYVVLPYYPPPMTGPRENREFAFSTRIRAADVFFLVDNSQSMDPVIANLRSNLSTTIVPGIQRAIPDIRVGVGSFDAMPDGTDGLPGRPGDYTLWVRQAISPDVSASQTALNNMRTIAADTGGAFFGGNGPECQTEASYEVIEGGGTRGFETSAEARISVRNALDPRGNGWVPRVDPVTDCGSRPEAPRYGWACFNEGRVPIIVLASDAPWHDGCAPGSPTSPRGHNCNDLVTALNRRGGFFVGVDVGLGVGGLTYNNAQIVAERTRTTDGSGMPVVFGPGRNVAAASAQIVEAITRLAGQNRQDITTRVQPDPTAMDLPSGRTTADFIKAVTPVRGEPDAPDGYDRRDMTTFFNVAPSTRVIFNAEFYNDFMEGGTTARLFRATIEVLGRAGAVVDSRPVFIVVPARGSGIGVPG